MKFTTLSLAGLAVGTVAILFGPAETSEGFTTIGGSLSLSQRDIRVFDNFQDNAANNNTIADSNFPGYTGAELAIWKAASEWASEPHGTGAGDPTQTILGSGGANFDATWQGNATGVGGTDNNIASSLGSSCGGGTLAFVETPISNGWRMRFCEEWTWQDGPGTPSSGIDIQAVATHEYGHSLGLGHTNVSGATMFPSIQTATGARSLATDDINGVKSIYGTASANKPSIDSVTVNGSQVTITGTNFSASNNQVWFTNVASTATNVDPRVILSNVTSSGGTITVNAPADAGSGDVLVRNSGSGNSNLSNAWPIDLGTGTGAGPMVTAVTPSVIDALIPGTERSIVLTGTDFSPTTQVLINGIQLTGIPSPTAYVSPTELRFDMPQLDFTGAVLISVQEAGGNPSSIFATVAAPATPKLQVGTGDIGGLIFQLSGLDVKFASNPGDLVYIVYSTTNVPSVLPGVVSLGLGNNFLNIPPVGVGLYAVPGKAWDEFNLPVSGITTLPTVYSQCVRVTGGPPYAESNLQEFIIF